MSISVKLGWGEGDRGLGEGDRGRGTMGIGARSKPEGCELTSMGFFARRIPSGMRAIYHGQYDDDA